MRAMDRTAWGGKSCSSWTERSASPEMVAASWMVTSRVTKGVGMERRAANDDPVEVSADDAAWGAEHMPR